MTGRVLPDLDRNWLFSYDRMAFYIRGSQETERLLPPVSVVIIDPEEIIQAASLPLSATKMSNTREHAHLVDLLRYSVSHP